MARYKPTDYAQGQFIPISFEQQILPGTFEYALNFIVDNKLDFSSLSTRLAPTTTPARPPTTRASCSRSCSTAMRAG